MLHMTDLSCQHTSYSPLDQISSSHSFYLAELMKYILHMYLSFLIMKVAFPLTKATLIHSESVWSFK
jgi:hypothetical protein